MRFDDEGYVRTWAETGAWPEIHRPLYELVSAEAAGLSILDLACSTGLLGLHLSRSGFAVVGVDSDVDAIAHADAYGVTKEVSINLMTVNPREPAPLLQLIRDLGVSVLVARRCFPEIFGADLDAGQAFFEQLRAAGVREVFVQGRLPSVRTAHPLGTLERELALMASVYRPVVVDGQLAYLKLLDK